MGIFSRLFKIGQAKANQITDKLEKPELMLEQAIKDKESNVLSIRTSLRDLMANKTKIQAKNDHEKGQMLMLEHDAEILLKRGDEAGASNILRQVETKERITEELSDTIETMEGDISEIRIFLDTAQQELDRLKSEKDVIITRCKIAKMKKETYEVKANMSDGNNSADDIISRMDEKSNQLKYEADATKELADLCGTPNVPLDITNRLNKLKEKIKE